MNNNLVNLLKNRGPSVYTIRNPYSELQLFKQQIDIHHVTLRPFTSHKKKIKIYRIIFLTLAAFYFLCGLIFFYKLSPYTSNFLLGSYSFLVKNGVCAFCALATLFSIGTGLFLNAEKEATHFSYKKARAKLKEIYYHNLAKIGLKRFLYFGENRRKITDFIHLYHESLDRLHFHKDDTTHLIERINTSESLDLIKRELLLNHALLEMEEKMNDVIHRFKSPDNLRLLSF
jgi:hypothetical protein